MLKYFFFCVFLVKFFDKICFLEYIIFFTFVFVKILYLLCFINFIFIILIDYSFNFSVSYSTTISMYSKELKKSPESNPGWILLPEQMDVLSKKPYTYNATAGSFLELLFLQK